MFSSQATTRGVTVHVTSSFVPEQSTPSQRKWFFAYRIRISNSGPDTVRLVNRHWVITDADGQVQEVHGPGVVGEHPVLRTGESFEYTSFCPLTTPYGTMEGSYEMVTDSGETFLARIAPFTLSEPMAVN